MVVEECRGVSNASMIQTIAQNNLPYSPVHFLVYAAAVEISTIWRQVSSVHTHSPLSTPLLNSRKTLLYTPNP
jgi:hypothetical protein